MKKIVDFFDAPEVLIASAGTPIPSSIDPPLEVVHSLAEVVYGIQVVDGIAGEWIHVYKGDVGQEVLACIVGPNTTHIDLYIAKGSRISIRSRDAAISAGGFCLQFLGLA